MENASKALVMAGGVLIGILIMSLAVYLFISFGDKTSMVYDRNAEQQIVAFNNDYTKYLGKEDITIYDVISVTNKAKENNEYYNVSLNSAENEYISVYLNRDNLVSKSKENLNILFDDFNTQNNELKKYKCTRYNIQQG